MRVMRLLALVFAVWLHCRTVSAQQPTSEPQELSGSAILSRPCHEAGYSRCCRGRNDSCVGNPPECYCDEFCLRSNSGDCCEDLVLGLLRCDASIPGCADTLEARVRGLAEIQTVLAETYVGLPDHFATVTLYLQTLRRQVTNNLFSPFDANNDGALDRDEFHLMYQGIVSDTSTYLDICEDDFFDFCNGNQDGNVTDGELELCTGVVPYCDTSDDTAIMLASELLVSQLQPVFADIITRDQFTKSIFPFADRTDPRDLLDVTEFRILYARAIEQYNILPSVCPESVFELCNTDDDLFISLDEVIRCGSKA